MKSVFYVPVYNEITRFPQVLRELQESDLPCDEILLVNNGSTDGSADLVRESGFPFLDLEQNTGVGGACTRAIDWALEQGFDVFGSLAGNGKMLPSEMGRVLEPVMRGEAEWVTGSRFLDGGQYPNLPSFRRGAIPLVNLFVWLATGHRLTDSTCGYHAWHLDLFRRADFDWHAAWLMTYAFEYYFYAKVILDGQISWKEVPISMNYPAKGTPFSKIRPGMDWYLMLKPWIAARLDRKGFRPE